MERGSRRIGRWCIVIGLLASGTLIALPSGVVQAEGYAMWPSDEQRALYMAPVPNNLPGLPVPYPITVPVGELFFNGDEDPITGFDRHIEVDTTEDAATCNASRATEPDPTYIGCSSIKLNVSHGDLKVGGAIASEILGETVYKGAHVQTTANNTAADGDADDSFELYIRGLEAEINDALADLSYVPADGYYHTGGSNDVERLDLLLSTAQGSIADNDSRSVYIRVMDVNDWPEVTAPDDPAPIDAASTLVFGDVPVTPDEGTTYTGTKFHTTDEDNDDGTQDDDDDEGDEPKQDGPYDDSLVVMWTTCGSFEITNKNTFTVSEHLDELIDAHFNALYSDYEDLLDNPAFAAAIEAMNAAIEQGLDDAGLDETLLATQSEWTNERVAGFAGLASDMPGVLDAFDEVTFFAREPGATNEGTYLEGMTCEMYAFVSDLGNNGLPLASAGFFEYYTGTYDIAAPFPGFDWDSVEIEIEDGQEIDISFDTIDPVYVVEGESAGTQLLIAAPEDHPGFEIQWSIEPRIDDPELPGQAIANSDFQGTYGNSIVVPAGATVIPIPEDLLAVDPPSIDAWNDSNPEGNETFTFTLDTNAVAPPPGYTITTSTPSRPGVIVDNDDDPATVSTFANVAGPEGDVGDSNVLTFTVGLGTPADGGETVDVVLTESSATNPEDYGAPVPSTLTFGPGDTSATFDVPIVGDDLDEGNHTFTATLENATGGLTITDGTATGTIEDDDGPNQLLMLSDASVTEGDVGDAFMAFTLTLSEPAEGDESVTFEVTPGTATAPDDYSIPASLDVGWDMGETEATFLVPVHGDTLVEGDHGFTVSIVGSQNVGLGADTTATGTILDDDEWADISIADAMVTEDTSDVDQAVVSMTNWVTDLECTVTVTSGDASDTADAPDDYAMIGPDAVFLVAMASDVLGLTIDDDFLVEGDETFTITVELDASSDPRCRLLDGTATVTIDDDDEWADISIADAMVTEDTSDVDQAVVSMTNWVTDLECTVTVTSGDASDTADAPDDYAMIGPDAVFLVAMASDVLGLTIVDDAVDDDGETFTLSLALDGGADPRCRMADDTAIVTITDDDGPPSDLTPPSVSIDQAGSQGDPTSSSPIEFTVVFSEVVSGFETGDVTLGGTAGATTAVVTDSGDSMSFSVLVSGMTGDGTVIASVPAGVAMDAALLANTVSTSTDNVVDYVVPAPGTPLAVTAPDDITVPNDPGLAGAAVVFGPATASGGVPPIIIDCSRDSGDFFPLGTTTVTCTATDSEAVDSGGDRLIEAVVSADFTVTVLDVEPPVIDDAPDLVVPATSASGAAVTYVAPAATDNAGPPTVVCAPASGLTYPIGATTVTCTATDAAGNSASSSFTITVTTLGSGPTPPPTTTVPTGTLPPTGGGARVPGLIAFVLVALGVGLVASSRKRSRSVNGV